MVQNLDVLIVEDSPSFSLELEMLIEKLGYNVINVFDKAEDALLAIKQHLPDLILMDIDLKGKMTGVELSKTIAYLQIPLVFITSYGDQNTYDIAKHDNMLAYLVKPISTFSLKISIETAIKNTFKQAKITDKHENFFVKNYLFLAKNGIYHKVHISKICYIQSSDNYCEFIIEDGNRYVIRLSISNLIDNILPKDKFVRIHRQYIIALNQVLSIDFGNNLVKLNTTELPISRSYKKHIKENIIKVE